MTWTTRPRSRRGGLAVLEAGAGLRVLLLHGVGLRAEAWTAQIDGLAAGCEVIAPDLPGHGESDRLGEGAGLREFSESVAALLGPKTLVVGHSMGAMIALDLAIRHSERVAGVAALNAIFRRSDAARATVARRAAELDGDPAPDPSPTLQRWFGAAQTPERAACAAWLGTVDPSGYRTAYRVFAAEDGPAEEGLAALACPALFLTGGREPNSTPAMSHAMAALAPAGRASVIDTAAHMMPMTHAGAVTAVLKRFAGECLR